MTKSTKPEAMDLTSNTTKGVAIDPLHGHSKTSNSIIDRHQTPITINTSPTLDLLSSRLDILSLRISTIQDRQQANFESTAGEFKKLRTTAKQRHDGLTETVESIQGVLTCVHDEFHRSTDNEEDEMNMADRLGYLVDMAENNDGTLERLREGFCNWKVVEQAGRRTVMEGAEKMSGGLGKLEAKMKVMVENIEKMLEAVEKLRGKELLALNGKF